MLALSVVVVFCSIFGYAYCKCLLDSVAHMQACLCAQELSIFIKAVCRRLHV